MKVSTGSPILDNFLGGGYDRDIITTIFGPSGTGKTNLCLLAAVRIAEKGKKVIFLDLLVFVSNFNYFILGLVFL